MIALKKIDVYGQALIFGFGILLLFADKDRWIMISVLFSLPIGCWQLLSAGIHFGLKNKLATLKERNAYICAVIAFIILIALTASNTIIANKPIVFWYFFLASTSLAIWYLTISFRELTIWEKRRLIQFR